MHHYNYDNDRSLQVHRDGVMRYVETDLSNPDRSHLIYIFLPPTRDTTMRRFDIELGIGVANCRGTHRDARLLPHPGLDAGESISQESDLKQTSASAMDQQRRPDISMLRNSLASQAPLQSRSLLERGTTLRSSPCSHA